MKTLTAAATTEKNKTSTSPRLIVRIDWPAPVGTKYYSEEALSTPVTAENRLVEVGELSMWSRPGDPSAPNVISDWKFTLRDEDGVIREYLEDVQAEKSEVIVYQHFVGNALGDLVTLMQGVLTSPVERDGTDGTITFGVDDTITEHDKTIGTIADKDTFSNVASEDEGRMIPLVYGGVERVKAVCVQRGPRTVLEQDIDTNDTSFRVKNASDFPSGPITIRVGMEEMTGSFTGNLFTVTQRARTVYSGKVTDYLYNSRKLRDRNLSSSADNQYQGYICEVTYSGYTMSRKILASYDVPEVDGGGTVLKVTRPFARMPWWESTGGMTPGSALRGASYIIRTSRYNHYRGEVVEQVLSTGIIYAVNDVASKSVDVVELYGNIKSKHTDDQEEEESSRQGYLPVNPADYSVNLNNGTSFPGLGHNITTVTFYRPPEVLYQDALGDEIFVSLRGSKNGSSLLQTPDEVIKDILTTHLNLTDGVDIDTSSFTTAGAQVDHLRFAFAVERPVSGLGLAADLAFQSRCVLLYEAGQAKLKYLAGSPDASADVALSTTDVQLESFELYRSDIADLVTEVVGTYEQDGEERRVVAQDSAGVSAYGRISKEVSLWAYRVRNYAEEIARFYVKRWAMIYERVRVKAFLTALETERMDTVSLSVGADLIPTGQRGIVEGVEHQPGNGQAGVVDAIGLDVRLPRGAGCDTAICEICEASCETGLETCVGCETGGETCGYFESCWSYEEAGVCGTVEESYSICTASYEISCGSSCQTGCDAVRETGGTTDEELCPFETDACDTSLMTCASEVGPCAGATSETFIDTASCWAIETEACGLVCETGDAIDMLNIGTVTPTHITDDVNVDTIDELFEFLSEVVAVKCRKSDSPFVQNIQWTAGKGLELAAGVAGTNLTLDDGVLNASGGSGVETGAILDYGGSSVPSGYLDCDGSAVNRTTYADLFSAIGTLWGSGDGSTTFNVPDLRRRATHGKGASDTVGTTDGQAYASRVVTGVHSHGITGATADASVTVYDHGQQATDGPSATINVPADIGATPASGTHTHNCQGYSHYVEDHSHDYGSLDTEDSAAGDQPYAITLKIIKT